jgi:hypothetical protein
MDDARPGRRCVPTSEVEIRVKGLKSRKEANSVQEACAVTASEGERGAEDEACEGREEGETSPGNGDKDEEWMLLVSLAVDDG